MCQDIVKLLQLLEFLYWANEEINVKLLAKLSLKAIPTFKVPRMYGHLQHIRPLLLSTPLIDVQKPGGTRSTILPCLIITVSVWALSLQQHVADRHGLYIWKLLIQRSLHRNIEEPFDCPKTKNREEKPSKRLRKWRGSKFLCMGRKFSEFTLFEFFNWVVGNPETGS